MNLIVRYCWILIFLSGIYTCNSQDILHKADSLVESGDYSQAGLYYEWLIYSDGYTGKSFMAVEGRIRSYKQQGLYSSAAQFIDQLPKTGLTDSTLSFLSYESLLVNYLTGNYQEVISRYLLYAPILKNSGYETGSDLLLCLSNLRSGKYDRVLTSAEKYISKLVPADVKDSLISEFNLIFEVSNLPKLKNPKTARILSMIIPGSGQVYAGYPGDGFISFGLHVIALGGAGLAFINGFYVTGWIGGLGVLQKLYFGGNHRAAALAEQKNRLNKESFVQPALEFLVRLSEEYH